MILFKQLLLRSRLPNVDIAVKILELEFLAAAINGSADSFIDLDQVLPAPSAFVLHHLLWSIGLEVDIKVTEYLTVVCTQVDSGFQVCREGHINGAVHGTERHSLLWINAIKSNEYLAIQSMGHGAAGGIFQGHFTIHVVDVQL